MLVRADQLGRSGLVIVLVRTLFLLKYLNDPESRRTIHAATNKSEQFNDFAQWLMFGRDGTIAENLCHEQRKVIKYNQLVPNMVILYNVQWDVALDPTIDFPFKSAA